jgi:hypothetical protein
MTRHLLENSHSITRLALTPLAFRNFFRVTVTDVTRAHLVYDQYLSGKPLRLYSKQVLNRLHLLCKVFVRIVFAILCF